jgi:hypothetical protein
MDSLPPGKPASLILPPIEAVPGVALEDFVTRRVRRWGGVPVEVPPSVTVAFFVVLVTSLGMTGWSGAVLAGSAPCTGLPCDVVAWGGPALHLVLAAAAALALAIVAVLSRGFTALGPAGLAAALAAAVCGVVAVSGVAALLIVGALVLIAGIGLFVTVVDRL